MLWFKRKFQSPVAPASQHGFHKHSTCVVGLFKRTVRPQLAEQWCCERAVDAVPTRSINILAPGRKERIQMLSNNKYFLSSPANCLWNSLHHYCLSLAVFCFGKVSTFQLLPEQYFKRGADMNEIILLFTFKKSESPLSLTPILICIWHERMDLPAANLYWDWNSSDLGQWLLNLETRQVWSFALRCTPDSASGIFESLCPPSETFQAFPYGIGIHLKTL